MAPHTYARSIGSWILVFGVLSSLVLLGGCLAAENKASTPSQGSSHLATDLIGIWALAGTPGDVNEPPATGGQYKFIVGGHWAITQADPNTGTVIYHHGGTYTLNGDEYIETVKNANENTSSLINRALTYKVNVEGDTLNQTGVGNPWTQVWKRAK
jgi:glucose dehydrogenase